METQFTQQEHEFVKSGGNLWYVQGGAEHGWEVMRWSLAGRALLESGLPSRQAAEEVLLRMVHPTSFRTRTALHHAIPCSDVKLLTGAASLQ